MLISCDSTYHSSYWTLWGTIKSLLLLAKQGLVKQRSSHRWKRFYVIYIIISFPYLMWTEYCIITHDHLHLQLEICYLKYFDLKAPLFLVFWAIQACFYSELSTCDSPDVAKYHRPILCFFRGLLTRRTTLLFKVNEFSSRCRKSDSWCLSLKSVFLSVLTVYARRWLHKLWHDRVHTTSPSGSHVCRKACEWRVWLQARGWRWICYSIWGRYFRGKVVVVWLMLWVSERR